MPLIENCSLADYMAMKFSIDVDNAVAIRIADSDGEFYHTKWNKDFMKEHHFHFNDVEEPSAYGGSSRGLITEKQAFKIAQIIKECLEQNKHIIVHCMAGISRSGAVVEAARFYGFDVIEKYKIPNCAVKTRVIRELRMLDYNDD